MTRAAPEGAAQGSTLGEATARLHGLADLLVEITELCDRLPDRGRAWVSARLGQILRAAATGLRDLGTLVAAGTWAASGAGELAVSRGLIVSDGLGGVCLALPEDVVQELRALVAESGSYAPGEVELWLLDRAGLPMLLASGLQVAELAVLITAALHEEGRDRGGEGP